MGVRTCTLRALNLFFIHTFNSTYITTFSPLFPVISRAFHINLQLYELNSTQENENSSMPDIWEFYIYIWITFNTIVLNSSSNVPCNFLSHSTSLLQSFAFSRERYSRDYYILSLVRGNNERHAGTLIVTNGGPHTLTWVNANYLPISRESSRERSSIRIIYLERVDESEIERERERESTEYFQY